MTSARSSIKAPTGLILLDSIGNQAELKLSFKLKNNELELEQAKSRLIHHPYMYNQNSLNVWESAKGTIWTSKLDLLPEIIIIDIIH